MEAKYSVGGLDAEQPALAALTTMRILLIEDDLNIGHGVMQALPTGGLQVVWVRSLNQATQALADQEFEAIVLDLGLPDGDGLQWLVQQRLIQMLLPVIVLSARDSLSQRLQGLEYGADDYLVKPFALGELLARLHAALRRARGFKEGGLTCRGLVVDPASMCATVNGHPVALSRTEFQLLCALVRRTGRVVARSQLEELALLGAESNSLDMHMSNLRKKLGAGYIRTVRGVGYVIDEERSHGVD